MGGVSSAELPYGDLSIRSHISYQKLLAILVFSIVAYALSRLSKNIWTVVKLKRWGNRIPGPKESWLSGNAAQMVDAGGLAFFLEYLHDRYGSVARYWDGMSGLSVSLCDPEMLQEVGAMKLEKRVDGLNFLKGLLGPSGIGYKTGKEAKSRRQLWHAVLSGRSFQQSMLNSINREVRHITSRWQHQGVGKEADFQLEFTDAARRLWLQINQINAFGSDCHAGGQPLYEVFTDAVRLLQQLQHLAFPLLPFSPTWVERRRLLRQVHEAVSRCIGAAVKARSEREKMQDSELQGEQSGGDLLSLLLEEKAPDGTPAFSRAEVHDEVLTLLYGVYDNSPILSHTMHHLACNQDLQRTAQAEIDEVWGSQPPKSMEQLSNLRFIRACMEEGLRMSAGSGIIWRILETDAVVGGHAIPKGSTVVAPIGCIHHDAGHWPEPERFQPSRFLEDSSPGFGPEAKQVRNPGGHPLAYMPFGFGTRTCLGQKYALSIGALVLGHILQQYHVTLSGGAEREIAMRCQNLSLEARHGIHLTFQPRQS